MNFDPYAFLDAEPGVDDDDLTADDRKALR